MCRTASPPRARGSTSCVRRRGARSCAEIRQCRAVATPDRFGFHLAQAVGVALQRSWPQVRIVVPKLHPQQKSWSLPTQMRTETRSKSKFPIRTVQKSMPPPGPPGMVGLCFFGSSATMASVVMSRPATEAAPCSGAHYFGRVDDALRDEIAVLARLRVIAVGVGVLLQDLADHDRAVLAGIDGDLARGPADRLTDDLDAGLLVVVVGANLLERLACAQQRHAPARQDAFLDRGAGRVHGVIYAVLALPHFDLGRATDSEHRDAACTLG